jgi:hypothetical protein
MAINNQVPQLSNDYVDQMLYMLQRYYPGVQFWRIFNLVDFPIVYEQELVMHYLRGGAAPFIDTKTYTDLGVGWTFKAMEFEDEEDGEEAETVVNNAMHDMQVHRTLMMHDAFYRLIGRASIIKTYNGDGSFYQNNKMGITGFDCINPMTLTMQSIRNVMNDNTGSVQYEQLGLEDIYFDQDRVIYSTNNPMSHRAVLGNSDLAPAITDLRALARFPHYRSRLADNISNAYTTFQIDPVLLKEHGGALSEAIFETATGPQDYANATATFFTEQKRQGKDVAYFSWINSKKETWAGQTPDITQAELDTIRSIGFKLGVPIELIGMGTDEVNRATLETINDVYVAKSENGVRKHVFTPIIEDLAKEILLHNDITEGYLKVQYNPFLSKNLLELGTLIQQLWPTGAVSKPDIRELMGMDENPDLGGEFWEDKNPLPNVTSAAAPTTQTTLNVQKMLESQGLVKRL